MQSLPSKSNALFIMQIGIHILRIGGGDAVLSCGQLVAEGGTQVKQDAFTNKGHDGFIASVERELAKFGGGKLPNNFLLVLTERFENSFLEFSSGSVTRALDYILPDGNSNSYDETGRGYEECEAEYVPILVCELGYSESFKYWFWGCKEHPTGQPQYPVCVLTREQFEKCRESINNLHK